MFKLNKNYTSGDQMGSLVVTLWDCYVTGGLRQGPSVFSQHHLYLLSKNNKEQDN